MSVVLPLPDQPAKPNTRIESCTALPNPPCRRNELALGLGVGARFAHARFKDSALLLLVGVAKPGIGAQQVPKAPPGQGPRGKRGAPFLGAGSRVRRSRSASAPAAAPDTSP